MKTGARWAILKRRLPAAAAMTAVAGYFLGLTQDSLRVYFSPDDLMNLYRAWLWPLGTLVKANLLFFLNYPVGRPMGALWYRVVFHCAGFHPFWFHAANLAILIVNILLTCALARSLSGSRAVGTITAFLFSYVPRMAVIYFDTGFIYDVLCYFFYAGALLLYVGVRGRNRRLSTWQTAGLCGLYACALSSKEMAVTLPVFLAVYEALYHPPSVWRGKDVLLWLRSLRLAVGLLGLTLVFAAGRASGANSLIHHPAYRPLFTAGRFMETSRHFFGDAASWQVLLLWAALFLLAWLTKSHALRFAALFLFLSPLPVAFIAPREAGQYYLCWFGWSLYGAMALVGLFRFLTPRRWRDRYWVTAVRSAALLAGLTLVCYPLYKRAGWEPVKGVSLEGPKNLDCVQQLHRVEPRLAPRSRILFLNDPVRADWYNLLFMVRLSYRDRSLVVGRVKQPPTAPENSYDYVLDYKEGRFVELRRPARDTFPPTGRPL